MLDMALSIVELTSDRLCLAHTYLPNDRRCAFLQCCSVYLFSFMDEHKSVQLLVVCCLDLALALASLAQLGTKTRGPWAEGVAKFDAAPADTREKAANVKGPCLSVTCHSDRRTNTFRTHQHHHAIFVEACRSLL